MPELNHFNRISEVARGVPARRSFAGSRPGCWSLRLGLAMMAGGLIFAPALHAHGDDQLLIEALTEELAKAPEADLFIRRGELFRHHQEWAKAEADFSAAARLEPSLVVVDFFRARTLLESGASASALPLIDRYIAKENNEAEGWFLRGEVMAALEKPAAGAEDYAEGIRRAPNPRPEHFIRRAKLISRASPGNPVPVLTALDEGITRLGPVISLVEYAIALELDRKEYARALERIAFAMEKAPRRETWLVRQGDVLMSAGRSAEAIASYRAALAAIEELPDRYRETVPMEKLARDARRSLERLSSK